MDTNLLIEKFKNRITDMGGELYEVVFPARAGLPRYLMILPGGHVGFVEIGDKKMPASGAKTIHNLRKLGCAAFRIESEDQIYGALAYVLSDAGTDPSWLAYQSYLQQEKTILGESET